MVGTVAVGGGAPVSVQSMCTTDTRDRQATREQIDALARAGCDIVRVAVPDGDAARALRPLCLNSPVPLVADIHFDAALAVAAAEAGAAGLRYNPGTLDARLLDRVVDAARDNGAAIRVGINGGSLPRQLVERHGGPTADALVEAALAQIRRLENRGFHQVKVSLKASDPLTTVRAGRRFAEQSDLPLHLGVTEAGPPLPGAVKSALVLGGLLSEGIGDTVRVSLAGDPPDEVRVARLILSHLGLGHDGLDVVACPTCGRAHGDVARLAAELELRLRHLRRPLQVAVMGCEVNGPAEARSADLGLAATPRGWTLFRRGELTQRFSRDQLESAIDALATEAEKLTTAQ